LVGKNARTRAKSEKLESGVEKLRNHRRGMYRDIVMSWAQRSSLSLGLLVSAGSLSIEVTYLDILNMSSLFGVQSLEKSRHFDDPEELLGHFEAAVQRCLDPIQGSVHPVQGSVHPGKGSVHPAKGSIHPIGGSVDVFERLIDAHDDWPRALVDDNRVFDLSWGSTDIESF
jgi:hypothetical protein